jgi:quinohemoprotein ethanol dehydrogenase
MTYMLTALGITALSAFPQWTSASSPTKDVGNFGANDWPSVGGGLNNSRYSSLTQISTKNVKHLGTAWIHHFDANQTSRVTPIVKDGVMFVTAQRAVYALNAKTGEMIWRYISPVRTSDPDPSTRDGASTAAPNFRGVSVGQDLVFVGLQDGHVIALNRRTGTLVWIHQTGVTEPKQGQSASAAPTYADGVVFSGLSNGDANLRGRVTAIEAATGKRLWQLFTVPAPGESGHETWPADSDVWRLGGGGVWTNVAVDRELGLAYVTTGNAVPAFAGELRPGDNLYTCSLLAIDIKTGRLRWYYQLLRHDVFDADAGTPAILYETKSARHRRKAIAVLRADGYLFLFDRETGEPLLPIQDRAVPQLKSQATTATQPFPAPGDSILMDCEDWGKVGIPKGFSLGCMWTPPSAPPPSSDPQNVLAPFPSVRVGAMAYSPDTGYLYAQGTSFLAWARRSQDPYHLTFDTTVLNLPTYGELAAIDSRTGKIAWRRNIATVRGWLPFQRGSLLATAGGLVFRTSVDGNVEAYDASTGDVLWTFQTGIANLEGSPMSYAVDGEQHVALSIGSAVLALKLGGQASTSSSISTAIVQDQFTGPVIETDEIETTTFHRYRFGSGTRYFVDEYTFNPYRARVRTGATVLFVNNGVLRHEIVSMDGSWGTGPLAPAEEAWVTFPKAGAHTYICKEHPWSYGQILVEDDGRTSHTSAASTTVDYATQTASRQLTLAKEQFARNCAICHGEDLRGRPPAPALSGPIFTSRWRAPQRTQLLDRIRTTMPPANPGSLSLSAYESIVTYLLYANGLDSMIGSNNDHASSDDNERK